MNYQDYQKARDQAWAILVDQHITSLPVRVGEICRNLGITVKISDDLDERTGDGCSFFISDDPVCLISRKCSVQRQRFTLAHELGHILRGDVGKYRLVNREPSSTDNPIEQAANIFASRLLAPACVLWGCRAREPEQIAALCDISLAAARWRAERMKVLYERNKFLTSPKERQVYEQFEEYIKTHQC